VSFSLLNKYIKFRDCLSHFSGFIFTIDSTSYKFAPLDSAAWDAMRSSPSRTGLVMTFARRSRGMAVDCCPVEAAAPSSPLYAHKERGHMWGADCSFSSGRVESKPFRPRVHGYPGLVGTNRRRTRSTHFMEDSCTMKTNPGHLPNKQRLFLSRAYLDSAACPIA